MRFKTFFSTIKESAFTPEMEDWFNDRTRRHISLVQKYADRIEGSRPDKFSGLIDRSANHDASKFEEPEYTPYVFVAWKYRCNDLGKPFDYPDMADSMNDATLHHIKANPHHPEYHSPTADINRNDRDKPPEEMIDATAMQDIDIGEMVADWLAMSEEKGTSTKEWADKNVGIRWKFTEPHVNMIYELIERFGS